MHHSFLVLVRALPAHVREAFLTSSRRHDDCARVTQSDWGTWLAGFSPPSDGHANRSLRLAERGQTDRDPDCADDRHVTDDGTVATAATQARTAAASDVVGSRVDPT